MCVKVFFFVNVALMSLIKNQLFSIPRQQVSFG
jgi:hypothetical protein